MKNLFIVLLALSALAPSVSQACGEKSQEVKSVKTEQLLLRKVQGQSLICTGNNNQAEAVIQVYALYRCGNSPIYGVLEIKEFDFTVEVKKITQDKTGALKVEMMGSDEFLMCTLK